MTKIFNESDITIDNLAAHIRDSGLVPYMVDADGIRLRSPQGLGFRIAIIENRKFIQLMTYLPLRRDATLEDRRELARRLNEGVFLPVFTIDQDEDLSVSYSLPFTGGLVAAAFMSVVNRFGSLLEYVVHAHNDDALIDFGRPAAVPANVDSGPARGVLLN
ncbi:MAG: YbjN domain-containing protein [Ralstonia sp.]|uniref:YbjN domain-containing protein n=1 Tax=Ralstonia pickettii TaxID=329 RepID=A0AAW4Q640_RALPI|nr:YbjN domain-containing protein [Ralstonia pickettii]MBX3754138.1 YbjN domain-containing protein [Ralstonia pickettii]MBX3767261.1 YbjN domain-containing protein [Ralstonia pickettii]MBX3778309.1 YbjN domain-containing protein [Ralstonia pickettii]MBX3782919.1 YbjN domain-containing protein [Ralstonia pickettii]MBX3788460.1 YbjN domain-containing protein [Ralstonia pickettii]